MAPITSASNETNHQPLMDSLDIASLPKPFRNPTWRPPMRRNKNVKQIISEASRSQASILPTPAGGSGIATPVAGDPAAPDMAKATRDLAHLVVERNANALATSSNVASGASNGNTPSAATPSAGMNPPLVSYSNIESAPSLHPSSQRHYCDITGLPAAYTDPKSRLRYCNGEVFRVVRGLGQHPTESYLAARGAHTVLK
ncbi:MAG: hypothetical protein M1828_006133 [Chrysothrix sp. TS-e1954]|nr:MAG: hypothetical protein M1828_006133 [Chrysothrix sp. TS-e1954]